MAKDAAPPARHRTSTLRPSASVPHARCGSAGDQVGAVSASAVRPAL